MTNKKSRSYLAKALWQPLFKMRVIRDKKKEQNRRFARNKKEDTPNE